MAEPIAARGLGWSLRVLAGPATRPQGVVRSCAGCYPPAMARPRLPDLTHLDRPGTEIAVRATPRARRPGIAESQQGVAVAVTEPPEDGRANAAVRDALAAALGVAKSRLTLVRGAASRDKVFRLD